MTDAAQSNNHVEPIVIEGEVRELDLDYGSYGDVFAEDGSRLTDELLDLKTSLWNKGPWVRVTIEVLRPEEKR